MISPFGLPWEKAQPKYLKAASEKNNIPLYMDVDHYIEGFPPQVQMVLQKIRNIVFIAAPECTESIAYGMPAYKTNQKPLVYFAAFKEHIGFYATPAGHQAFDAELSAYKRGKGSVQFPLDKPIPYALIKKMVRFKVKANAAAKPKTKN